MMVNLYDSLVAVIMTVFISFDIHTIVYGATSSVLLAIIALIICSCSLVLAISRLIQRNF